MKTKPIFVYFLVGLFLAAVGLLIPVTAQLRPLAYDQGALGLALALRRLPVTASLLYSAAHPDDEDNPLLVMLNRGRGMRTGLLTLTRGSGGQNEIGPELFEALGVLRTEELSSMHRYDGARQFFGRARDFGYSFSVEETFEKWGKEEILKDVVHVIRTFRPDVIVTLPTTGRGGGQHHQAAAKLTVEAFRAAADPARFPKQITAGLRPWQAKKIYERYRWGGGGAVQEADSRNVVLVETGLFDPLLGESYFQIGMHSRSYHRCQGMGQLVPLGERRASRWKLVGTSIPEANSETDIFDGVQVDLFSLQQYVQGQENLVPYLHRDLAAIENRIKEAVTAYRAEAPQQTAAPLAAGLSAVRNLREKIGNSKLGKAVKYHLLFLLSRKEEDFGDALNLATQLSLDAVADDGRVVPGQEFELSVNLASGSPTPLEIQGLEVKTPPGWQIEPLQPLPTEVAAGQVLRQQFKVTVPESAQSTRRYWQRHPKADRYQVSQMEDFTKPWGPAPVSVEVRYRAHGVVSSLQRSAQYRYEGPWVGGEQRHEVMVVPKVSLTVDPDIGVIPVDRAGQGYQVQVTALHNGNAPLSGKIRLELPPGWRAQPEETNLVFSREGQSITEGIRILPPTPVEAGTYEVTAIGLFEGRRYQEGFQVIDYHHIQQRLLYHPARARLKTVQVAVKRRPRVGYVMGVGDYVPQALSQLGVDFKLLSEDDLASADLDQLDVILTGVRAYLNREDLRAQNQRLLDWVRGGGNLVVQYNKFEFNEGGRQGRASPYSPFPAEVGRGRITDEDASVTVLETEHPIFNAPNRIGELDWSGWVQERGLYFLGKKDSQYSDLVSLQDPFEYNQGVKLGSLVEAKHGRGRWIYVGLGLWRQLPAGVPGAYRILANLISLERGT